MFILNALGFGHYGLVDLYALVGMIIAGCILTPLLLPLLPSRAFSVKGAFIGLLWAIGVDLINGWPAAPTLAWPKALAYLLIIPAVSGFLAMNFTGRLVLHLAVRRQPRNEAGVAANGCRNSPPVFCCCWPAILFYCSPERNIIYETDLPEKCRYT